MKNRQYMLGAHFSIAKGLHRAVHEANEHQCDTLQIFTKNANSWKEKTIAEKEAALFEKAKEDTGITKIASHTSYLINLASPDKEKFKKSCDALEQEMIRSSMLNLSFVVLHPGSHMKSGEKNGIQRITEGINTIFNLDNGNYPHLLLETTAGQGSSIGHTFESIAALISRMKQKKKIGVCMDTSHIFAAGYDIRNKKAYEKTFNDFDRIIGLKYLKLIHMNDSKKDLGTRVDRHENIGKGFIGIRAFELIMNDKRLADIPKIIETPKDKQNKEQDIKNLNRLRKLVH